MAQRQCEHDGKRTDRRQSLAELMIGSQIDHGAQKHSGKDQRQEDQAEGPLTFGKAVVLGIGQRVGYHAIEQFWI